MWSIASRRFAALSRVLKSSCVYCLTNIWHTRFHGILELKFKLRGDQTLDLHSVLETALGWAHDSLRQPDTWYSNTVLHTVALLIGADHFWSQL